MHNSKALSSSIPQTSVECLPCARHGTRSWGHSSEQDNKVLTFSCGETSKQDNYRKHDVSSEEKRIQVMEWVVMGQGVATLDEVVRGGIWGGDI